MKTTFKTTNDLPVTLQAADVADVLGLSRGGAYNLLNSQDFPKLKIGKRIIVPKEAFLRWLDENTGKEVSSKGVI